MTVDLPAELEKTLVQRAQERRISPQDLMQEALHWYLQMEPAVIDELNAWQEVRDEALRLVEEAPS